MTDMALIWATVNSCFSTNSLLETGAPKAVRVSDAAQSVYGSQCVQLLELAFGSLENSSGSIHAMLIR